MILRKGRDDSEAEYSINFAIQPEWQRIHFIEIGQIGHTLLCYCDDVERAVPPLTINEFLFNKSCYLYEFWPVIEKHLLVKRFIQWLRPSDDHGSIVP